MTDIINQPAADGMIPRGNLAAIRLGIGLAQGIALWLLLDNFRPPEWTIDKPWLFTPLLLAALGVPVLLLGGVSQMRWKSLLVWAGVATVALLLLGLNDALRFGLEPDREGFRYGLDRTPSPILLLFGAPALFIAHHLAAASDADRRIIAEYPRYFDIGWTSAAQVAMGGAMIGALWLILWIGSAMFGMLGIYVLSDLIGKGWFAWPATCLAFALAIQLTDDRAGLVRGMRTLALVLLSWLMPVMTLFVVIFLIALPFTGLQPLWRTGSATAILLAAEAAIVALVNAAWQDGGEERTRSRFLRVAGLVACATVAPLVAIAAYSLWLRIDQYGFTPDRIAALVAVLIAAVYAVGYLVSLFPKFKSQSLMQRTNVAAAFVCVITFLAVFSPVADPARISVDDQVARLVSGKTTPTEFDYRFLRWDAAKYGRDALSRLTTLTEGPNAKQIAELATVAQQTETPYGSPFRPTEDAITVYPKGRTLPDDLVADGRRAGYLHISDCFQGFWTCDAILADVDKDGQEDALMLITGRVGVRPPDWGGDVELLQKVEGTWTRTETFDGRCAERVLEAFREGRITTAPTRGYDLMVGDQRLALQQRRDRPRDCP